jgi:hypothetical protein
MACAADVVPKFDIAQNCKAETADASGIGESISSCTARLVQRAHVVDEDQTGVLPHPLA